MNRHTRVLIPLLLLILLSTPAVGDTPKKRPLVPEDLYRVDAPQMAVAAPQGGQIAYIRRSIDGRTRLEQLSLYLATGDGAPPQSLEVAEPDARFPVYSPDGKWIAIRSTRPRSGFGRATPTVPPPSDPVTDIWLFPASGPTAIPLSDDVESYGRVFADPFYGRVAFSPDGKRLAFVADDGRDPHSKEEIDADAFVVRPDQGEGYTGYGAAQIWIADLAAEPRDQAATRIRRLTKDKFWYGDPQWTPDGKTIVVHVNKTADVESVRFSINKNYDLWAIDVETGRQRQLTFGPGAEVSPRIAPDGKQLVCLSTARQGPHTDIYSLRLVDLTEGTGDGQQPKSRLFFDHHPNDEPGPHPDAAFPLPDQCWDGANVIIYSASMGTATPMVRLDLATLAGQVIDFAATQNSNGLSPLVERMRRERTLPPRANQFLDERLSAEDRVVKWTNDELELEGVLTTPPAEVAKPPYPLILFPHGGPHSRSQLTMNMTAHLFAAQGYAVFQPNFRGSSGYGRKFLDADRNDLGGGDMRDILSGIEMLIQKQLVDRERQFVYGVSYGGYMTCWLVGHTKQFRAAVAQNAVTDMNIMWGTSDIQSWTRWELDSLPWENPERYRKHSPSAYVNDITTPTLILHARDDRRCPLPMGTYFYRLLLARGVPTQMVIYPDEGHGIRQPKHLVDVVRRTLAWFKEYEKK